MKKFLRYFSITILSLFYFNSGLNACQHCSDLRDDCLTPRVNGGGSSGKWLDNVTPKRGWNCTAAEDLGLGNTQQCEMCEREQVRYIHHMTHGDQNPLNFEVGCICAGHMEGRFDDVHSIQAAVRSAQDRTRNLENRAARRLNFPDLNRWKLSKNNNPYIPYDGQIITIFQKEQGYSAVIKNKNTDQSNFVPGVYNNVRDAKLAVFDVLNPARIN